MYRSFTDRVFGGVCGGLAARLPLVNSWALRVIFVLLATVSLGAFAVLYLMLWLALPQESLAARVPGGSVWAIVTLLLTAAVVAGWAARLQGLTLTTEGTDLFYPLLALLLSLVFFFKQLGRSA